MQPPISIGTILQNRYRLTKVLGHGSMVRTYLAEDEGRFNELCALKEVIPAQSAESIFEKSKELFQRETTILYQIQHPQVPQVRATFECDRRFFLVQDYVEGKTLATMLLERQAASQTFVEAEVLQLFEQLLPPLAHLHSRGVVHRGISPNNIIILSDRAPVLTNFGIFKDLATRFQSPNPKYQLTPIGIGYAPIEQIQTGIAYPSSDLYALAVTAIVLLTGLEPQELFNDAQLLWHWQQWVTLSPQTSEMLNRMLSYKPSDRYQSVTEVEQALHINSTFSRSSTSDSPWMHTVVGSRPTASHSNSKPQPDPASVTKREIWDRPWAVVLVYIIVAILAGVSSGILVSSLLAKQRLTQRAGISPQTFPSPLVSESSTPTPTASDTPTPSFETRYSQRLNLKLGQKTTIRGSLRAKAIDYTFHGEQGQQLSATLTNGNILLSVLGLNQAPLDDSANRVMRYQGTLPSTGDYIIELSPTQGVTVSRYRLGIRLGSVQQTPNETSPTSPSTVTPIAPSGRSPTSSP